MTYSWSDVEEVNCSSSVSGVALGVDWDVHVAPPDGLKNDIKDNSQNTQSELTSLVTSSKTTLFSFGVLPVLSPDETDRAPL